jgi:hypothetical protein
VTWRKALYRVGLGLGLLLFARHLVAGVTAVRGLDLRAVRPAYLVASIASSVLASFLQMCAWTMVMRYLAAPVRLHEALQGYTLSFLPRYIPGTVWGYFSRGQWLENLHGVHHAVTLLGSVLEAVALVLTAMTMSVVYFAIDGVGVQQAVLVAVAASLLSSCLWVVPALIKPIWRVAMLLTGNRRVRPVRFPALSRQRTNQWSWFGAVGLYLLFWGTQGVSAWSIGRALAIPSLSDLTASVFVASSSWLAGFLCVAVPAGIGVRELTLTSLLVHRFSVPDWQGSLVAVLSRLWAVVSELIWLGAGVGMSGLLGRYEDVGVGQTGKNTE